MRIDHGGESAAKNAGVRAARGDWVALLDADDRFLPGRLAALVGLAIARPDLDLLTTDAWLELDGRRVGRCYHDDFRFAADDQRAAILDANFVFGHVMVRRDRFLAVGGFDTRIRFTADWECWIRLVLDGGRFGLVDAPLSVYRMHEAAMSAGRADMYQGRVDTLTKTGRDERLTADERDRIGRRIVAERGTGRPRTRTCRARPRRAGRSAAIVDGGGECGPADVQPGSRHSWPPWRRGWRPRRCDVGTGRPGSGWATCATHVAPPTGNPRRPSRVPTCARPASTVRRVGTRPIATRDGPSSPWRSSR